MTSAVTGLVLAMGAAIPLPDADPLGYPLPAWILRALAYLTLTLHLSAMQFTVGGALILLWARFRQGPGYAEAARFLGSGLPLGVSYLVTLGIPPLLFVQVLYGQMFYSSSVLLGAYWIQVIPVLILAYAGFYYHKLRRDRAPSVQGAVVAISVLLLLYIGYIYVSNLTLLMSPEKWGGMYAAAPAGNVLHHHEPTLHGRYLLFLASSFGVAGLALIWRGVFLARWGHAEQAGQSSLLGARAFVVTPFLWLVGGLGVYFGRSEDVRDLLTSGAAAPALLLLGAAGGVVASIGTYRSRRRPTARQAVIASVGVLVVTACMVVLRDLARIRELSPHWSLSDVPINAQWGMFGLFVAALLGGVVLLVILARKVFPNMVQASLGAAGRS